MLNYRLYGSLEQGERPLVILHGLLGSLDNWHTFASKHAEHQAVISLDMRNHGKSPHEEGMSYSLMVDDILATLAQLDIQYFDLLGHSMGGKAAMLIALQRPELIHKLIVVDIAPVSYPPRHQSLLKVLSDVDLDSLSSRKEADQQLSSEIKHPFERGFLLKNLGRSREKGFFWHCNLPEISRHYLKISAFPTVNNTYAGATLFISGTASDYITDETWQAAQAVFTHAQLVPLEQAGHYPHVQKAEAFTQAVEAFLA